MDNKNIENIESVERNESNLEGIIKTKIKNLKNYSFDEITRFYSAYLKGTKKENTKINFSTSVVVSILVSVFLICLFWGANTTSLINFLKELFS